MKFIDKFLNSITMYRLVLYGLSIIAVFAVVFGFVGLIPYSGLSLLASLAILLVFSLLSNLLLAKIFKAPTNIESFWITAFILFFILTPVTTLSDAYIVAAAAVIAMASKYVLAINKKHIFNPAAIAAVVIGLAGSGAVSWWVGSIEMVPLVLVVGLLIVRKIRRFAMFWSFVVTSIAVMVYVFAPLGLPLREILIQAVSSFPLLFFATVMLTEPLTSPPKKRLQIAYGVIIGVLFSLPFHVGPVFSTPELALVIGNIFSYIVSMKRRVTLTLKSQTQLSALIHDFAFVPDSRIDFQPGQYLEWTLPHHKPDTRGNRRYFTIASSPTEPEIHLGVRIQKDGSSFKDALLAMQPGGKMVAGVLSGEFTLPKDSAEKMIFIAGGIGVTPFRSMVKFLMDKKERRDITLFYACASENDFVYTDLFDKAAGEIGLNIVRVVTDAAKVSEAWKGKTGYITAELIAEQVPDFRERICYLSGPDAMVQNYKKMLLKVGVSRAHIRTDYFPGF